MFSNAKVVILAAVVVLVGCGGAETPQPPHKPPAAAAVPPQPGTYRATGAAGARALVAAGPAMVTTMISAWDGGFVLVLPNYDVLRGGMAVNPDGTLQVGTGLTLTHQDGTTAPATLVGTSDGTTINGTINGTETFSVTRGTIQDQTFTVAGQAGTYLSTSSNTGLWYSLAIDANGNITGYGYATQADAQLGDTSKALGMFYGGTIIHQPPPASAVLPDVPNEFSIGFSYEPIPNNGPQPAGTYGFAYLTGSGLVALTVNPVNGGELVAVFAKQ